MIAVDGVSVALGGTTVLSDVSLSVDRGRFVGLVGPNGAGKTTLLRTINGRIAPSRGSVRLDGDPVDRLSARQVGRRVATVPQETTLAFDFDVRTVVEMGRNPHVGRFDLHDPGSARVDEALARTGTAGLAERSVTTLSGGERQRVLVARALAQEAPVLLLDEPTANLDVGHQVATLDLVSDLVGDGRTAVAAIHDLDLAARYCDALVLLAGGEVRAVGPPADVLTTHGLEDAFGARVSVGRNPVTGSPAVTALSPSREAPGPRVHVVSGGGRGLPLLYPLAAAGLDLSAGPLHEGDPDAQAADALGADPVTGAPFAPFDDGVVDRASAAVDAADATVLADLPVGPANAAALDVAAAADRLVVVEDRPFSMRNHAGPGAARRYERLRDRGRLADADGVVEAVAAELDVETVTGLPSLD